jgi:fused signal recognition particle receptor
MFNFFKKENKEETLHTDTNTDPKVDSAIDSNSDKNDQSTSEDSSSEDKKQDLQPKEPKNNLLGNFKKGLNKTIDILNTDISDMDNIRKGLGKTREILNTDIVELVNLKKTIDDDLLEEIESQLLMADIGVESTLKIIDDLSERVAKNGLTDVEDLFNALEENMNELLKDAQQPLVIDKSKSPYVILMVGINGAGKTTTIGKLAKRYQQQGYSVMLAAGDTFRAAAVEQLQVWGERNDIPVIAQHTGADSASVIYDAIEAGKARNIDIVIADTAGRLHTQSNLMDELSKVKRVAGKIDATAPHEVMLVLDAGTGQNAINQAESFLETVGVTGITLTKLDGTAKGGIIFALAHKLNIPIRFIGVGEGIDDMKEFNSKDFVSALLSRES